MYAHKYGKNKFEFIFDSELKVKMCFPSMKTTRGSIVKVNVEEVK